MSQYSMIIIAMFIMLMVISIISQTGKHKIVCSKCKRFAYAILTIRSGGYPGWIKRSGWKTNGIRCYCPQCSEATG